jgi:hypothetical protein
MDSSRKDAIVAEFIKYSEGYYVTELDIPMQMWLGLYLEPKPGDPNTWEDEHRKYSRLRSEWEDLIPIALREADKMLVQASQCHQYEDDGLTYREVARLVNDKEPSIHVTNSKYDASEDLMFLYNSIGKLYTFVFEARTIP